MSRTTKSLVHMTGGLVMIKQVLSSLPASERKVANYILKNPEESIICTASELGKKSGASSAALMRLCKSLGLKGLQDLKLRIAGDVRKVTYDGYKDILPDESYQTVLTKMTNNNIQAIKETTEIMNVEELERAVDAILIADKIHFFGVGASGIIAQDAQQKFLRINKSATAFYDLHVVATMVANIDKNDIVFGISYSGETLEVVKLLNLAKSKGAKTISLTRYGSTPVSECADINLFICDSNELTFKSGATSSRIAQLHTIDILFMCVVTKQYKKVIRSLNKTKEAIDFLQLKTKKAKK